MGIEMKNNIPIKLIIQQTEEAVDFGDFLDEILDFEEKIGVNKRPPENNSNAQEDKGG